MRIKNLLNILIIASLALSVLSVLVPSAEAQRSAQVTFTQVPTFVDPIKPLRPAVCQPGKVNLVSDATAVAGVIGVPVSIKATKSPPWANVIVSPSSALFEISPAPGETSINSEVNFQVCITTSDQAPAFVNDQVELTATTTNPAASQTGTTTFPIGADYFSILDVNVLEAVKVDRPQTPVIFPVKITNLGNANTKVTITPTEHTGNIDVITPPQYILQSKQAGGSQISQDVALTIQTPYHNGYLNEVARSDYKVTSAYALDPKLVGDTGTISVVLTTRGFYVPGFEPVLALGALGLVGLVLAVRRRGL